MGIPVDVRKAIIESPTRDPARLAAELTQQFGRVVSARLVTQVRGSTDRADNIERARTRASETLDENLDIMNETKLTLLALFQDAHLPLKDRLSIAKELRLWTKTETDTAGVQDASGAGALFVIESAWDMSGTQDEGENVVGLTD